MALSDRIKELRTRNGLSQAELAEKLHVSRQAVTKWESGRGYPDIDNLKAMATLFNVSVDYLLDDDAAPPDTAIMRHPVDVESLEPYKPAGKPLGAKTHAAVRMVFPDATIYPLSRLRKNTKNQNVIEWTLAFVAETPFGIFGTADSFDNRDAYYLVEQKNRQLLARVSKEAVESQELMHPVTGKKFTVGRDVFRRVSKPL